MSKKTIPERLRYWSNVDSEKTAFVFVDATGNTRKFSRKEIFQLSSKYAAILRGLGITRGDTVCNTLPNSPERLITDFGCALAGAVVLHGQIMLADGSDLFTSLQRTNCRAVIIDPDDPRGAKEILESHVHKQHGKHVSFQELPALRLVLAYHWTTQGDKLALMDILEEETAMFVDDVDPDDEAYIFTTSGTTGFSKLVPRTHSDLSSFDITSLIRPTDSLFNDRILGWSAGYPCVYLGVGSQRVMTDLSKGPAQDRPRFIWNLVTRENCTVGFLVPNDLEQLTRMLKDDGNSTNWRFGRVLSGGQPLKKIHMEAIGKVTDKVIVLYGSSECSFIAALEVTDAENFVDGNAGKPMSDTQVRIVDKDFKDVVSGKTGEILVRSPRVCRHYMDNEKTTKEMFLEGGWFRTGDVGLIDTNGDLQVIGRDKFAIVRGAFIFYPIWLESLIQACPGVQSVVVIPVPDPVLYQEICACVIPGPGSEITSQELTEYCQTLFMTTKGSEMFAVPKYFVFFETFPTTDNGKVSREDLIKIAKGKLNIDE